MSDLKKGLGIAKPSFKAPGVAKSPGMPKVPGVDKPKASGIQNPIGVQPVAPSIGMTTAMANPMKVGSQATVKTPKPKGMAQANDKPSKFFKGEVNTAIREKGVQKLNVFLNRKKK